MQVILGIFVFGLIAVAIIVMVVINVMYRNLKRLREDAEDYLYRRGKRREQKERNPFDDDYFKSSRKPEGQNGGQSKRSNRSYSASYDSAERNTARRTTTSDGVTIIDQRQEDKKIFDKGDDEYVEFEEV
jgi:hypothetical protein